MEPSHWQLVKEAEKLVELWKQKDLKARLRIDMDVILHMYVYIMIDGSSWINLPQKVGQI